ncbi:MAG: polysaccharide export (CAP59) [Lasallia pustulata]|uniref:Polysaccharide export (CAP59) n=1 Tax=Lasallia pustulata TaxID=136370 RepID=A0A5M8PQY3_9LECA|nr:MAG: polysaccharide export (CAP59) [Lasallia pustulata]
MRSSRAILLVLLLSFLLDFLSLSRILSRRPPPATVHSPVQRIYITAIHWNNEVVLQSNWNKAVLELAKHLGPENIYISIYESGGWDDSKGALRSLDAELGQLGVPRTVILDETTHADELATPPASSGWIDTPRGKNELRRIPYLSKLRNTALKPLLALAANGTTFDKLLFLNDVVFTTADVTTLLATRNGAYAAACSLDFSHPPAYYDTFGLRDSEGHETVIPTFPYFRSWASRDAMVSNRPVPVQSCWNGIVAFDATPFYSGNNPLQFRGIPDSLALHHLEGSECCLIHADNPLTPLYGVWLNPSVRVGYNPEAYAAVHPDGATFWPPATEAIRGIWWNRIWRWVTPTFHKRWLISGRLRKWKREGNERHEPGVQCLIKEMQVLIWNGWAHV